VLARKTAGGVITGVDYHDGRGLVPLPQFVPDPAPKSNHTARTAWACPEYALNMNGHDIETYDNIQSWQECGQLCQDILECQFWSWHVPRKDRHPKRCWLKNSDAGARNDLGVISGHYNCIFDIC